MPQPVRTPSDPPVPLLRTAHVSLCTSLAPKKLRKMAMNEKAAATAHSARRLRTPRNRIIPTAVPTTNAVNAPRLDDASINNAAHAHTNRFSRRFECIATSVVPAISDAPKELLSYLNPRGRSACQFTAWNKSTEFAGMTSVTCSARPAADASTRPMPRFVRSTRSRSAHNTPRTTVSSQVRTMTPVVTALVRLSVAAFSVMMDATQLTKLHKVSMKQACKNVRVALTPTARGHNLQTASARSGSAGLAR